MVLNVYHLHAISHTYIAAEEENRNTGISFFPAEYDVFDFVGPQDMLLILQTNVNGLNLTLHIKGCIYIYRHMKHC